jgi:hypothetical protein
LALGDWFEEPLDDGVDDEEEGCEACCDCEAEEDELEPDVDDAPPVDEPELALDPLVELPLLVELLLPDDDVPDEDPVVEALG